jgi:hypothetical protein
MAASRFRAKGTRFDDLTVTRSSVSWSCIEVNSMIHYTADRIEKSGQKRWKSSNLFHITWSVLMTK